jgi:hypothetical protein
MLQIALQQGKLPEMPDIPMSPFVIKQYQRDALAKCDVIDDDHFILLVAYLDCDDRQTNCDLSDLNFPWRLFPRLALELPMLKTLVLSAKTEGVSSDALLELGSTFPTLEAVYLPECPGIEVDQLKDFYSSGRATFCILHPGLMKSVRFWDTQLVKTRRYAARFGVLKKTLEFFRVLPVAYTIPFWNPASIIQIIRDVMYSSTLDEFRFQDYPSGMAPAKLRTLIGTISRPAGTSIDNTAIVDVPDKLFGPTRGQAPNNYRNAAMGTSWGSFLMERAFSQSFSCWMLILDPHLSSLDAEAHDDGIRAKIPYSFARIENGHVIESLDFEQFLEVLGLTDRNTLSADLAYWITDIKRILTTSPVMVYVDHKVIYKVRGLTHMVLDELLPLVDSPATDEDDAEYNYWP